MIYYIYYISCIYHAFLWSPSPKPSPSSSIFLRAPGTPALLQNGGGSKSSAEGPSLRLRHRAGDRASCRPENQLKAGCLQARPCESICVSTVYVICFGGRRFSVFVERLGTDLVETEATTWSVPRSRKLRSVRWGRPRQSDASVS